MQQLAHKKIHEEIKVVIYTCAHAHITTEVPAVVTEDFDTLAYNTPDTAALLPPGPPVPPPLLIYTSM